MHVLRAIEGYKQLYFRQTVLDYLSKFGKCDLCKLREDLI